MTKIRVVVSTIDQRGKAEELARTLVEERLAACVNLVPGLTSIYRWKGRIEEAQELLLVIKTGEDRLEALLARLKELHPYEVAEALVLPVEEGNRGYLEWVWQETRP